MSWLLYILLAVEPIDARVINQNGTNFVCVLPDAAQKLLQLRLDFPILEKQIKKYDELVSAQDAENERLIKATSELSEQLVLQNQVNDILRTALNAPEPWYKRPSFWAGVGVVVGVGMTVLVYELVQQAHNDKEVLSTTTSP